MLSYMITGADGAGAFWRAATAVTAGKSAFRDWLRLSWKGHDGPADQAGTPKAEVRTHRQRRGRAR